MKLVFEVDCSDVLVVDNPRYSVVEKTAKVLAKRYKVPLSQVSIRFSDEVEE